MSAPHREIPEAAITRIPTWDRERFQIEPITTDELDRARLTPRKILANFIYADVRTRIAAGGTGKTTLALYEAATLALARELYGRKPEWPCRTVIVTREDSREILVARLREVMRAMNLDSDEIQHVLTRVLIFDKSGSPFRLSCVADDIVIPDTHNLDAMVSALTGWNPDWIICDPLVSFGVGEARVNDAEQGLIEAFRILRNRLDCCAEGIHHCGKQNARDKVIDQYAGRGGSSLADGSRMVAVMQPLNGDEWLKETGTRLSDGESGIVMALPKLSYCKPQDSIFIRRHGYAFEPQRVYRSSPEQAARDRANQVLRFLTSEFQRGHKYSARDLENSTANLKLKRQDIREAATTLKVSGQVVYHCFNGKPGSHFEPLTLAEEPGEACPNTGQKGTEIE